MLPWVTITKARIIELGLNDLLSAGDYLGLTRLKINYISIYMIKTHNTTKPLNLFTCPVLPNLRPDVKIDIDDVWSTGPPTNGVDNPPNGNLGADNPGVYENLPFHGLQQPPNKVYSFSYTWMTTMLVKWDVMYLISIAPLVQ